MVRIIAIANNKGGVGKTTTAINIGAALANEGKKVLIIDLDPQANASIWLFGEGIQSFHHTVYHIFTEDIPISDIVEKVGNLYIAPASQLLTKAEQILSSDQVNGLFALRDKVESIKDEYDYILLDCPPSLNSLTINALVASTDVFIPIQTSYLPAVGSAQLAKSIRNANRLNRDLQISGVILTMYDQRKRISDEVVEKIKELFGGIVFQTTIRTNSKLEEAPALQQTIFEYAPNSYGAEDYLNLAKEVLAIG